METSKEKFSVFWRSSISFCHFSVTSIMTGFWKELHSILTATEALIFKIKIVPCPFLIRVLINRFKNTKNKVMYKPSTPCLEKPWRFKQVDLNFVAPIFFFVCYSVTNNYCTEQSSFKQQVQNNNLCLSKSLLYGEPFSLLLQQNNWTCTRGDFVLFLSTAVGDIV